MNFSSFIGEFENKLVVEQPPLYGHQLHFGGLSWPAAISVGGSKKPVHVQVVFALHWLRTQPSQRDPHLPAPLEHLRDMVYQGVDVRGHTPWVHAPLEGG